ncbi:LuxR C-terminal-related transcriptional regulator [Leucobacter sp. UT-8R-CII-1-4]|uniref:helix-turn-helix transcriptional regulator n=1 Tax=Leucobacter sp. UT-8R-CII-1-4 TaxID=3040075 RepID=UPI0024A90127|nr:LuxR C-terminal-related transcriptional regulator [Leucobacter sp. UT-8R-CII-1-4]MDI6024374.1 LuxR C-terminal-related transcriptional regulator [Leucobacter sp. UT-8R-CII-1-4]
MTEHVYEHGAWIAPRVSANAFARPRLFARLDGWPDITLVTGPIGSGKTTLLAAWMHLQKKPGFWARPNYRGDLPLSEIANFAAHGSGVLVIDNAEQIATRQFAELGAIIDQHSALQIALASRTAQTAVEIASRCEAGIKLITGSDLQFTVEELSDAEPHLSEEARHELIRSTGGLAVAVSAGLEDLHSDTSIAKERLRNKLRSELITRLLDYQAAVKISVVPKVDRAVLRSWGIRENLLDHLHTIGMGSWERDWFVMQPFIRGVIHEDAELQLADSERSELVALAIRSSYLERDEQLALQVAIQGADYELANEIVLFRMVEFLEHREDTLRIVSAVPASKLRGQSALTILLILLNNSHPDTRPRALQLMARESLMQRVQPGRGSHCERVVYRAFEAAAMRLAPFKVDALNSVRRAYSDFSSLSESDFEALGRLGPMIYVHLGISAFYLRDVKLARSCFELADAEHMSAGRKDRVDPLSMRAGLAALNGEVPLARRLLDAASTAEWPEGWLDTNAADFYYLAQAILAIEDGDHEAASRWLLARPHFLETTEHWRLYALVASRRDNLADDADLGLVRLRQLREQRGTEAGTPLDRSFLDAAEAELLLAQGKFDQARKIAARSAKNGSIARSVLARIELALDRPAAAAIQAQRVVEASSAPRHIVEAELVLIGAALRSGERVEALASAQRVVELLRISTLQAPLRTVPPQDRATMVALLREAGLSDSALSLVAISAAHRTGAEMPPPKLTPRESTVLQLLESTGSTDEIAATLFISRNTVKTQLRSVYRKLDVSSREAALTKAALHGLFVTHNHEAD